MSFIYETYGPFPIERDGNKFRKSAFTKLWKEIETSDSHRGLSTAIGIYVLAIRAKAGAALKPWYVGKTDSQGFKRRFTQQVGHFGDVLDSAKNGVPNVFFIARLTPNRKAFMKPRSNALGSNDELETMMIASCLKQNKKLINARKVKSAKGIVVPGYMNNPAGKLTNAATELNRMVKAKS